MLAPALAAPCKTIRPRAPLVRTVPGAFSTNRPVWDYSRAGSRIAIVRSVFLQSSG